MATARTPHGARLLIVLPERAAVRAPFSSGDGCRQDRSCGRRPTERRRSADVKVIASEAFVAADWRRSGAVIPPPPGTGPGARGMSCLSPLGRTTPVRRTLRGSGWDPSSESAGSLHAFRSIHFLSRSISVPFNGVAERHPASGPSIAHAYSTHEAFRACCRRGDAIVFAPAQLVGTAAVSDSRGSTQRFPHITLIDQRTARARK